MYRRLLYVTPLLAAASMLLASCSGCSGDKSQMQGYSNGQESPVNPMVEQLDETKNYAFSAQADHYDADSIYVKRFGVKGTVGMAYQEARSDGDFYGTVRPGDMYSILLKGKRRDIHIAVNTTELSGRWIYDMQQQRGFAFNDRGGMSSINTGDICFREWKLLNGKMYIYFVDQEQRASERHHYQVEEARIETLNEQQLVITFHGQTYDCRRPGKEPVHVNAQ